MFLFQYVEKNVSETKKKTEMIQNQSPFDAQLARLKEACGVKTDSDLARILGITPGGFSGARRRGKIPHKWFVYVASTYKVDIDWLISGLLTCHVTHPKDVEDGRADSPTWKLEAHVASLMTENALLKELVDTLKASLRDKEETLAAYRQILSQFQHTVTALEKEGVIIPGAAPPGPLANRCGKD